MASYRELSVYRKSYELVLQVYTLTKGMPKEEQYGLQSQIRRAAVSIPLNIAEGFGKRAGDKETKRYLSMARGSCCEMDVLLSLLEDLGYMAKAESQKLVEAYEEVGKMLTGLMQALTSD